MNLSSSIMKTFVAAAALAGLAGVSVADDSFRGPPFDFSDSFYLANGINPATIAGRPTGTGPNSVIDNRENGPNLNNVRLLEQSAAYDDSGHPIFFSVTGLPSQASFTANSAGARALQIAEQYNVYEFPRAANAPLAVFPKAQDLIADLRNGYFSNNPLGVWKINIVHFTAAGLSTSAGQAALADIASRNGVNLDGRPLIRTISELESLSSRGFVTIDTPPASGGPGVFRWFFCPVLKDPRNGAIAPDAHLAVTGGGRAANEFITLFNCLKTTGDDHCSSTRRGDCNHDGSLSVEDIFVFLGWFFSSDNSADFDSSGSISTEDIFQFLNAWFSGT